MPKIMLVDDDSEVLEINKKFLIQEGYQVAVSDNARKAITLLKKHPADCIVIDVMMPEIDGFEACRRIREFSDSPIIFLTGRSGEDDRINGLMLGADDYIIKPYSLKELSARIHVLLRRRQQTEGPAQPSSTISFPPLTIDTLEHRAFCNDTELLLSNREFSLLLLLATHPGETITFEEIGTRIWGTYTPTDRRSIMVNASRLRKKLEDYPILAGMIETVWSQGYKFVPRHK